MKLFLSEIEYQHDKCVYSFDILQNIMLPNYYLHSFMLMIKKIPSFVKEVAYVFYIYS